jgi:hypothetical protein
MHLEYYPNKRSIAEENTNQLIMIIFELEDLELIS